MPVNYSDLDVTTQTGTKAGYKPELWIMPIANVTTWVRPLSAAAGDTVSIATAHTLATGKPVIQWGGKLFSVTMTSDPVGDPGALSLYHKATIVISGDNAVFYEQILKLINDKAAVFIKDADCLTNGWYLQLGDDCNPVSISPKFDGKNNDPSKGGQKEWTFEISSSVKFFYTAEALPVPAT